MRDSTPAPARGLYDPRFEHDACGIGFVTRLQAAPSYDILGKALTAVGNMAHRGGVSADGKSGDGAGVLTQIPRPLFDRELSRLGISYPVDNLAVGMVFLPRDEAQRTTARLLVKQGLAQQGLELLGWRAVPVDEDALGAGARRTLPVIEQALVGRSSWMALSSAGYERALYLARRTIEADARANHIEGFSIPSLSSRTLVYKGLLVAPMLPRFYPDLRDRLYTTALAVYHQRYSTNTFPTWERAQPFRMLSHNGEINTLGGNVAWMRARETAWLRQGSGVGGMSARGGRSGPLVRPSSLTPDDPRPREGPRPPTPDPRPLASNVAALGPVIDTSGSDSAMLDNVLELVVMGGRDIRHALAILVPEAWERVQDMDPALRAFYQYHSGITEPWDGPAALAFSDGQVVGLALDRNGLRPARYLLTDDGLVVCGSEVGAVAVDQASIVRKGKLGPGQMVAVDLRTGRLYENDEIKSSLAAAQPYARWLSETEYRVPSTEYLVPAQHSVLGTRYSVLIRAFGYTSEELTAILWPMLRDGQEPVGSMGDDTPPAFLAERARPLYGYFKQRFAEVTNPPIDPLREQLVMSLSVALGRRGDLLDVDASAGSARLLRLAGPVLADPQLAAIREIQDPNLVSSTLPAVFPAAEGVAGFRAALDRLCGQAEDAVVGGASLLIISDRDVDEASAPIPALLALGAVHQHLIRCGLRTAASLIVESGEPREVHHLACLVGMGAEAVNPYLAIAAARAIATEREEMQQRVALPAQQRKSGSAPSEPSEDSETVSPDQAERNYIRALEKGLLKVMSKMGIATVDSYCGAQVFEVLGLAPDLIEQCFSGVPARPGAVGLDKFAADALEHHRAAFSGDATLPSPGFYKYKKDGEHHAYSPVVVHALQKAVSGDGDYATYQAYSRLVHSRPPTDLHDLLDFAPEALQSPVALEEVEPPEAIVRRFSTAAMSLGSTSSEAHETLAVAMNRLGGLSNSGEGGEDPSRFGTERNSPIKQVASARFGVTPAYLASASELQIKMAQGSKPGEGGQLPGHKVSEEIARIRHATPGIELVSPPPHHDIYSIEDLAQLIYDLKQANPRADVSVKLVAEAGVGTVAAGVAKGGAAVILISGHSGGTGASPLSSIKNAGVNWELGLAEAQQTLVINGLRGWVRLRVDGGLKTGRDVVIAAMLGADEFSFGTAALVAEGCLMARTCHSNNCPVGIATQRPELRAKFAGTPEQVVHFFLHVAQEVREVLASLGARTLDEVTGRSDLLRQVIRTPSWPDPEGTRSVIAEGERSVIAGSEQFDLSPLLQRVDTEGEAIRHAKSTAFQRSNLPMFKRLKVGDLNSRLLKDCAPALERRSPVEVSYTITNRDRTVGATLSGAIAARYGPAGLPVGTVTAGFKGSAGQSFGAFLAPGVHLQLEGEANDYVGKGMSGGEIVLRPPCQARFPSYKNVIAGNTLLYGATGGALYAAGRAGERFAVRNSGALAVVEGVGDHGCEYMTGGIVLVLGDTGRNFAAGMTGGLAYVFDQHGHFAARCNHDTIDLGPLTWPDEDNVLALLLRHLELTGSRRADELLLSWDQVRDRFRRVQPRGLASQAPASPHPLLRLPERLEDSPAA
jgi:glutamate synthase (ferredoxin)